jgi:hypothetical protein
MAGETARLETESSSAALVVHKPSLNCDRQTASGSPWSLPAFCRAA